MFCPRCATQNELAQNYCRHCGPLLSGARLSRSSTFGRLLADYASNPINLCSVTVTSLPALFMSSALGMITRYPMSPGTALTAVRQPKPPL